MEKQMEKSMKPVEEPVEQIERIQWRRNQKCLVHGSYLAFRCDLLLSLGRSKMPLTKWPQMSSICVAQTLLFFQHCFSHTRSSADARGSELFLTFLDC